MKIAVSANAATLDAEVDPRFGRCKYLMFIDTDTMDFEAQDNASSTTGGGAGIATGQVVVNKDAQVVLTGNIGPNAHNVLSQAGIQVMTGVSGKVKDAVEAYKNGSLSEATAPTVEAHAGMSPSTGATKIDVKSELEALKGRANTMKQQLDNLTFRIEELEKNTKVS